MEGGGAKHARTDDACVASDEETGRPEKSVCLAAAGQEEASGLAGLWPSLHGPKLAQVLQGLSEPDTGAEAWASAVELLPVWSAELLEASCQMERVENAMVAWLTARAAQAKDAPGTRLEILNCLRQAGPLVKGRLKGVVAPTRELFAAVEPKWWVDLVLNAVQILSAGVDILCEDFSLITLAAEALQSQPTHSRL
jgi:hypothetical protein